MTKERSMDGTAHGGIEFPDCVNQAAHLNKSNITKKFEKFAGRSLIYRLHTFTSKKYIFIAFSFSNEMMQKAEVSKVTDQVRTLQDQGHISIPRNLQRNR